MKLADQNKTWKLSVIQSQEISKKAFNRAMVLQGIRFALCFFSLQLMEFVANDNISASFGPESINIVYAAEIGCVALGFVLFALGGFRNPRAGGVILCSVGAVAMISGVLVLRNISPASLVISVLLTMLCLGYLGGCVHYDFTMVFQGSNRIGRSVGIGMCCAVIIQYALENLFQTKLAIAISMGLAVALQIGLGLGLQRERAFEDSCSHDSEMPMDKRIAVTMIIVTILMGLASWTVIGPVFLKDAEGQLSLSSAHRLVYAGSLLFAGVVADIRNRRYLWMITICTMFLSPISATFMERADTLQWAVMVTYLYYGFFVVFLTVVFCDFAPKSKNPALWASMGRVVRCVATVLAIIPATNLFQSFGSMVLVIVSCIMCVLALVVLQRHYIKKDALPETEKTAPEADKKTLPNEAILALYAQSVGLTPREAEVLEKLILTEDGVQEIADSLFISRRVLQRYIASIYEKTKTKTRIGLFRSYTEFMMNQ